MRCVLAVCVVVASVSAAPDAFARPGTPNEVFAGVYETPVERLPRVMVTFRNTASEEVSFWLEWTENGVRIPAAHASQLTCPSGSAQAYHCNIFTLSEATGFRGHALTRDRQFPHAVVFKDLKFDSRYCFRLAAQDREGATSQLWSAWACTQTPSPPPVPGAPLKAQVTFLPGTTGRGDVGPPMPPRALFEWQAPHAGPVAWFVVEMVAGGRWSRDLGAHSPRNELQLRGSTSPAELEATLDLRSEVDVKKGAPRFRICSVNVSGSACTSAVAGLLLQTATPAAPIGGARAAAEPIAPKPVPSTATNASSAMSGPATAAASVARYAAVAERSVPSQQSADAMRTRSGAGTQVVAAADVPQQARQPARDRQQERESQQQAQDSKGADFLGSIIGGPVEGTVIAHQAAGDLPGAAKILCRGGKSMRLERMSEETARVLGRGQHGATYSLYFGTTEGTVGANGNGLHASTCAFLGRPWQPGDPPGIRFDTNPNGTFFNNQAPGTAEETTPRSHYLDRPDHYWLFFVKLAHGFFEAVGHEMWKPAVGPQIAATAEAIEAKPGVPKGATAASPAAAAQIPSNLFDMNDRAIIIVGGKELQAGQIKRELRAGLQRVSDTPAVLTLRKLPTTTRYATSSTAIVGESSAPGAQLARAAQSRAAAATAIANTPISGTSDQLQRASSLQVDCAQQLPRILAVHGALTPGASVRLEGSCFGERGTIELRGEFGAQGTSLRLSSSRWTPNAIEFLTPSMSGTRDHPAILCLTRADGARSPDKALPFSAKRRTVVVPAHKWTPRPNPEHTQILEGSDHDFFGAPNLSAGAPGQFTLQASIGVSSDCALDEVSATARAGRVQAIGGWDRPGPANVGSVSVSGIPVCATRVDKYDFGVYGHTDARRVCSLAIDLSATASCPEGIDP